MIPRLILSSLWVKTGGILQYFEDLRPTNMIESDGSSRNAGKRGTNKDIGPKDIFEIASNQMTVEAQS
jgi:hypothetical protein